MRNIFLMGRKRDTAYDAEEIFADLFLAAAYSLFSLNFYRCEVSIPELNMKLSARRCKSLKAFKVEASRVQP